jgi:hypothetical protein
MGPRAAASWALLNPRALLTSPHSTPCSPHQPPTLLPLQPPLNPHQPRTPTPFCTNTKTRCLTTQAATIFDEAMTRGARRRSEDQSHGTPPSTPDAPRSAPPRNRTESTIEEDDPEVWV